MNHFGLRSVLALLAVPSLVACASRPTDLGKTASCASPTAEHCWAVPTPEPTFPRRWVPRPPDAAAFEWQGRQSRLREAKDDEGGSGAPDSCDDARVTALLSPSAVCFVDGTGELRCAGAVGPNDFGSVFVDTGLAGVDQIITDSGGEGSAMCVHETNGTAWCLGTVHAPDHGQLNLGPGGGSPGRTWKQWGTRSDVAEIVTSTFDTICARYADGTADCTGRIFDSLGRYVDSGTPVSVGGPTPAVERIWLSDFAEPPHINETNVFRKSTGSVDCQIDASGLDCREIIGAMGGPGVRIFGTPGHVVDGGDGGSWYFPMTTACWLDDEGVVRCYEPLDVSTSIGSTFGSTTRTWFAQVPRHAVALLSNEYEVSHTPAPPSRCAVFDDGSLWCVGENASGKLGSGGTADLAVETEVAPPGSVRIHCGGS